MAALAVITMAASACRSATAPEVRTYVLEVAAASVPCTGFIPQQCLQVRERSDVPYRFFYDRIVGFTYEPGYHYLLRVGERTLANPPQDVSNKVYWLISVLSKTPAS